ncbi:MAG: hypothetical protein ACOYIP_01210 [Coriobacteriales bacterium]|jgi:ABC-2 type transport system permease protein
MSKVFLLTKVLLKQNLATMLGLDNTRRKRSSRSSLLATGIIAIVLLAITGGLGYGVGSFGGSLGLGRPLLSLLLGSVGVIMFMLTIPSVLGSFYASSDVEDLLPMPLSAASIVTAKGITALISSYVFPTMILLGPLLGWGIAVGGSAFYWLTVVAIVLFAPLLPFSYAGIVSMLIARVSKAARRKDVVTTITTVISIAIVIVCMLTQQFFNDASSVASLARFGGVAHGLIAAFPSYGFAVDAASTSSLPALLLFIVISLAGFAVFVAFAQLVYLRTVTSLSSSGGRSRAYGGEVGKASGSVGRAILRADLRRTFRTPALWLNQALVPVIIMAIATGSMCMQAIPPLMESMAGLRDSGIALASALTCSMTVLLAGLVGGANRLSGTVVSREGSNWDFMKMIPVPYGRLLKSKMLPGLIVNMVLLIVPICALVVPLIAAGLPPLVLACTIVLGCALAWLSSCLAVSSDTANPRVSWGNDAEIDNKTVGGGAGLLRAYIATVVYAALPLIALTGAPWTIVLPVIAVVGLVLAIVLGRLFLRKAARNLAELER